MHSNCELNHIYNTQILHAATAIWCRQCDGWKMILIQMVYFQFLSLFHFDGPFTGVGALSAFCLLPSAFCPFSLPLFTFYIWWCFFFSFPVESRIYGNWIAWWVKRTVTVYYEAMKSINMKYEPNKKKFFDRKQHAKLSAFSSLDIFITSKSDFFAVSSILYHG